MESDVQLADQQSTIASSALDAEGRTEITIDGKRRQVRLRVALPNHVRVEEPDRPLNLYAVRAAEGLWVWAEGRARFVRPAGRRHAQRGGRSAAQLVTPPMPAVVVKVLAEVGQTVKKGAPLVVVNAMKMEMTLAAPHDGTVAAVHTEVGAKVSPGQELVVVAATEGEQAAP